MRLLIFVSLLLCASIPTSSAQTNTRSAAPPAAGALPVPVRLDAVGATFRMPIAPTPSQSTGRLSDGTELRFFYGSASGYSTTYGYEFHSAPRPFGGNVLDVLTGLVDDYLARSDDAEVLSSAALWREGYPGVELELFDRSRHRTTRTRILVGRSHVYILSVAADASSAAVLAERGRLYFETLRLSATDAPSARGEGHYTEAHPTWVYPPEAGFAAEFPSEATRNPWRLAIADHTIVGYRFSLEGGTPSAGFEIVFAEFDEQEREEVVPAIEEDLLPSDGRVRSRVASTHEGFPARDVVIETGANVVHARIVETSRGAYVVMHTTARSDEEATRPTRERFFRTFRVLEVEP